jgi:hypothetical protein
VHDSIDQYISAFSKSVADSTFVKATLSNYKGVEQHLQKMLIRPVDTKKGRLIAFQYKFSTRDEVKNYTAGEATLRLAGYLNSGFRNAHLFTTAGDVQLEIGKRNARLIQGKATFFQAEETQHDRKPNNAIDPSAYYLKALGITTEMQNPGRSNGTSDSNSIIRSDQRDKWKQINKFVEVVDGLFRNSELSEKKNLSIVDMGSGKGYLTFAVYDHFANKLGLDIKMTGVESRENLVSLCNDVGKASGFEGLSFITGNIAEATVSGADILIALHACDTATDDALWKGIEAKASVIIAAPCCHKELKKQIKPPALLADILKHAVMLERISETLTDGIRSMALESEGYKTKMFEFVATEHTPKNNLLVATRTSRPDTEAKQRIAELRNEFGIDHQSLIDRLRQ